MHFLIELEKIAGKGKLIFGKDFDVSIAVFKDANKREKVLKFLSERKEVKDIVEEENYINVMLNDESLFEMIYDIPKFEGEATFEYPSVNPNKPLHLGHLRNALIGNFLSNLFEFLGFKVNRIDYINDLGLQMAYILTAFSMPNEDEKFDHYLGKLYVKAANEIPEEKAKEMLKKIENGEEKELLNTIVKECYKAQQETLKKFNVKERIPVRESEILPFVNEGIEKLLSLGIVKKEKEGKYANCLVLEVNGEKKVIRRSNGVFTYFGRDIVFHMLKAGILANFPWKAKFLVNIIGYEQKPHQECLKKIMKMIDENVRLEVVYHNHVRLEEGKFSGRKGTWLGYTADELLSSISQLVSGEEKERIAANAIAYYLLSFHPEKDIVVRSKKVVNTEGDSGVYLTYALVRGRSVLRKAGKDGEIGKVEKERKLLYLLSLFPYYLNSAFSSLSPQQLMKYANNLASTFNSFYARERIIGSKNENVRLWITAAFVDVMEKIFDISGFHKVEKM